MKGKVTHDVAELVIERDMGTCVAKASKGCTREQQQIHHRRARGMGSTSRPESNLAANLISLCASCHAWIESHRQAAMLNGWIIGQYKTPAERPMIWHGKVVLLDDQGGVSPGMM